MNGDLNRAVYKKECFLINILIADERLTGTIIILRTMCRATKVFWPNIKPVGGGKEVIFWKKKPLDQLELCENFNNSFIMWPKILAILLTRIIRVYLIIQVLFKFWKIHPRVTQIRYLTLSQ